MDLRELRLNLRRHWIIALLVFQICLLIGFAAAYLPAKTYKAEAIIQVDVLTVDEETGSTVTNRSIQQAEFLLPALQRRVTSGSLKIRVQQDVLANNPEFANQRVDINAAAQSSVLTISGLGPSPAATVEWVNSTAFRLVEENRLSTSPLDLTIIDEARPRNRVVSPNVRTTLMGAFALGLIAAVFAALAAERIRKAFDVHEAIRERVGSSVLGEIPRTRALRTGTSIIDLLGGEDPDRELAASFENIRATIEFRTTFEEIDRLAVVSLLPGVGKSTVSAGLGYAMASIGRDVVLVEADLRRPVLYERLNVRPGPGIGEMAAMEGLAPPLQESALPKLKLLPAGLPAGRPADVVSRVLPRALEEMAEPGRVIILDPPPLSGIPETPTIAAMSENVILVINSDSGGLNDLSEALDRIHESGANLLGVVVNRVPRRRALDSYYSYSPIRKHYPTADEAPVAKPDPAQV